MCPNQSLRGGICTWVCLIPEDKDLSSTQVKLGGNREMVRMEGGEMFTGVKYEGHWRIFLWGNLCMFENIEDR